MQDSDKKQLNGFPNPFAKPSEKSTKDYGLRFAKQMWRVARKDSYNSYNSTRKRIVESREWVRGTQSISHLKDLTNTGGGTSYAP